MSLSDPIGDMIARIKNAQLRNHKILKLPSSNFKVKILSQDTHNIALEMTNVSIIMANSIRRSSLILVPTMAIEHIYVYDNTSVMNDQMLSLRIGHIPLVTDLNRYILPDECDCESEYGCNKCSTTLTLNVTSGDDVVTVTSNDIKSQDNSSLPVSDNIPITKLYLLIELKHKHYLHFRAPNVGIVGSLGFMQRTKMEKMRLQF